MKLVTGVRKLWIRRSSFMAHFDPNHYSFRLNDHAFSIVRNVKNFDVKLACSNKNTRTRVATSYTFTQFTISFDHERLVSHKNHVSVSQRFEYSLQITIDTIIIELNLLQAIPLHLVKLNNRKCLGGYKTSN